MYEYFRYVFWNFQSLETISNFYTPLKSEIEFVLYREKHHYSIIMSNIDYILNKNIPRFYRNFIDNLSFEKKKTIGSFKRELEHVINKGI